MKVLPDVKVQTLADCKPGQLVRSLEYGEGQQYGLAYELMQGDERTMGILVFEDSCPSFQPEERPEQITVLAYSGEVVFEVDQRGPLETNARHYFDIPGVLIAVNDGWIMNAASRNGFGFRSRAQLHMQTGRLVPYQERLNKIGIFGAWTAYLEERERPVQERIEIARFRVKKSD